MRPYNFPEGVDFHGEDGDTASFSVTIPLDDDGFFGRECTSCDQHFRIHGDDYEALPDDIEQRAESARAFGPSAPKDTERGR